MSHLIRGLSAGGGIRVVAADTTLLVRHATEKHQASPTAGAALGRTLTGALLLAHVLLKDHRDRVTLKLRGDGPLGGVIADAGLDGTVRGYVHDPLADLPLRPDGKLDVGGGIGHKGDISVIRSHAPYGEPYGSSSDLVSGEVAEDIATYLARSEQIASAVLLGVYYDERGKVASSGGVILQALPGADEAALPLLEANVKALGQLTTAMRRAPLVDVVRNELMWGMDFELLTDPPLPVSFACRCSDEKALAALAYFTPAERRTMIDEDGGAEVVCHWCGEKRWVGPEALNSISADEVRCPDCATLWYRGGQTRMVRDEELCACGRRVELPN
ncbi:MAG: Hsp33 family molecular chaperone HslO [Truepera sp.]|jgi:molecular chaperone Hsp33|nr:Hsp33 family molecular chaperone HslO [Truepera sp.]